MSDDTLIHPPTLVLKQTRQTRRSVCETFSIFFFFVSYLFFYINCFNLTNVFYEIGLKINTHQFRNQ